MLLDTWTYTVRTAETALILPDGCQDVIVMHAARRGPRVMVSPLDACPRGVGLAPGEHFLGFRLRPGAFVDAARLAVSLPDDLTDRASLRAALFESCFLDPAVDDCLRAISLHTTFDPVADTGVSGRSLQRRFRNLGLPPPRFWVQLARARRAVTGVARGGPPAHVAAESGYSDQAHMTREFRRWFGRTPAQVRSEPGTQAVLLASGLATGEPSHPTGEQISTRYPSGSAT